MKSKYNVPENCRAKKSVIREGVGNNMKEIGGSEIDHDIKSKKFAISLCKSSNII